MRCLLLLFVSFLIFACSSSKPAMQKTEPDLMLHVPSPDWRDQVIYFIMVDRFNDGDTTNNDFGMGEYDPQDERKFSGGDLKGITEKLDYIKELGATSIWITPPVANQWWNPGIQFGGYHGYWAEHFKKVDKHFGSLDEYKMLSDQLHRRGMYLIHDIVVNHTGDFFYYKGDYNPDNPLENLFRNDDSVPVTAPTQFPFSLNDVRNPEHMVAKIYNWTPDIRDYSNEHQRLYYQLSGLDDLNTENQVVRNALKDAYRYWITEVGVDAYRIDTIIYVETDFWNDFVYSSDGMNTAATETGREDFLMFGEAFVGSEPYNSEGDSAVASYHGTKEKPGVNSMLNFPLHFSLRRVFAEGLPTAYLGYRLDLAANSGIYPNPHTLTNFIDNHDTQRFLETGSMEGFKQALTCLLTITGIPILYQGTEHATTVQRPSMFAGGWGSEGKDHFSTEGDMFRFLQELIQLRKDNRVFSRGELRILKQSKVGSGVLAYSRTYEDKKMLVLFNTADERMLLSRLKIGEKSAFNLSRLFGEGLPEELNSNSAGEINFEMPPRSYGVYSVETGESPANADKSRLLSITSDIPDTLRQTLKISGTAGTDVSEIEIVLNGKLDRTISATVSKGKWNAEVPLSRFPFGETLNEISAYSSELKAASNSRVTVSQVELQGASKVYPDPLNDDHGPAGNYRIPTDVTFNKQLDIEGVTLRSFGGNLMVELKMGEISTYWSPPNGFDHVSFQVFIDVPGKQGVNVLPRLNANGPDEFAWDYMSYSGGWTNVLFSANGATAENNGALSTPAPEIRVDKEARTVTLLYAPDALGNPELLSGGKVYITTWDGGGGEGFHRLLTLEGAAFEFGGGNGKVDPLILDDTVVMEIP